MFVLNEKNDIFKQKNRCFLRGKYIKYQFSPIYKYFENLEYNCYSVKKFIKKILKKNTKRPAKNQCYVMDRYLEV